VSEILASLGITGTAATICETMWSVGETLAGHDSVKERIAGMRHRAAGRLALPANHDLLRTIRVAHLTALDKITRRHVDFLQTVPGAEIGDADRAFQPVIRDWIDDRLSILRPGKIDHDTITEDQVRRVLDDMVHPSDVEGFAAGQQQSRKITERYALDEIEKGTNKTVPPIFRRLFNGDDGPGWYDIFALFVNEQIKTNERFRSIFVAAELVDIKRLGAATEQRIGGLVKAGTVSIVAEVQQLAITITSIKEDTTAIRAAQTALPEAVVARLLEALDARGETARAHEAGVGRKVILELARRFKEEDVTDFDQAVLELHSAVDIAINVIKQGRGANIDELVQETLRIIADKTTVGDFQGAADAADHAFARWEKEEKEQRRRSLQVGIALLNAGLKQDLLLRKASAAAQKARKIIEIQITSPSDAQYFTSLIASQNEYYSIGRYSGKTVYLLVAIELAKFTLTIAKTREERIGTLGSLGTYLAVLGDRSGNRFHLVEAIETYERALHEMDIQNSPHEWAKLQSNLGNVLQLLAEYDKNANYLVDAISAYRAALSQLKQETLPYDWALCQNNLGNALQRLSEALNDPEPLKAAIHAFNETLKVHTRDNAPLEWAASQQNKASALTALGERENNPVTLELAVQACRAALEIRTPENCPYDSAESNYNLGRTLQTIGELTGRSGYIEEAVLAQQNAINVITQEDTPFLWANCQYQLGKSLSAIGRYKNRTECLRQSIEAFSAAITGYPQERYPLPRAHAQNELGIALAAMGEITNNPSLLGEATKCFTAAIDGYEECKANHFIEGSSQNLTRALASFAARSKLVSY